MLARLTSVREGSVPWETGLSPLQHSGGPEAPLGDARYTMMTRPGHGT